MQARKEEAWKAAMKAGEGGDKTSDRGYLDATKAVGEPLGTALKLTLS